ncbi:MAG: alpha/beta hydrolase [Acidimicrobiia bacterium]|nr:alpha/beta hydrolase [Acidimicrobiia bacterium]MDH4306913.1 alpha/beta hydrolase [Acidimicrobiia bacterium]MDH5292911.1 alpha/beta hydrolase [Acidimicrobiia bacterium]
MPHVTGPDGNKVFFQVAGEGQDLVLIHGITENHSAWGGVSSSLASHGRVVSVDLRGHGNSDHAARYDLDRMAADVKAVADAVGASEPCLIGHSLGGFVASVYGSMFAARGIVNVDQPLALAGFKEQLGQVEELLRGDAFPAVIVQMFDAMMSALPGDERARITSLRRPDQDVALGVWAPVFEMSVSELDALSRDLLSGIGCPYLTILGDDLGPDYAAWLSSVIPHARIEVWAGHAHYPHLADPDRFVTRVMEFVG